MISGVGGLVLGLVPKIVDALKARKEDQREDQRFTYSEQRALLADLRTERDIVRKEMDELRAEHQQCLQRAAKQEEQIAWLNKVVEQQQRDINELKARIPDG